MDTVTIIRCLHIIEHLNLKGKEIVKDFTISEIEAIYNGIGPDRFPDWLREIVTLANGLFQPAALIHDLRYHIGGTKEDFTAANDEFRENCYALVNAAYSWYDPRRYKWLFRAWRYAGYCEEFGWEGYHKVEEENSADSANSIGPISPISPIGKNADGKGETREERDVEQPNSAESSVKKKKGKKKKKNAKK